MNKDQKGFSIIEGLIVVAIISFLGFAGWFVYSRQSSSNDKDSQTNTQTEEILLNNAEAPEETVKDDKDSLTQKYTDPEFSFTLDIPKEWSAAPQNANLSSDTIKETRISTTGIDQFIKFESFEIGPLGADACDSVNSLYSINVIHNAPTQQEGYRVIDFQYNEYPKREAGIIQDTSSGFLSSRSLTSERIEYKDMQVGQKYYYCVASSTPIDWLNLDNDLLDKVLQKISISTAEGELADGAVVDKSVYQILESFKKL